MKINFLTVMFAMLLVFSMCKKSPVPSNRSTTTPASTATTTNNASTAQAALVGHWVIDSLVYYNNGVVTITKMTSAANGNNYTYDMFSTPYGAANQPQMQENYGLVGNNQNAVSWCVQDVQYNTTGRLLLSSGGVYSAGYIILLTSSNLVVADNYAQTPQGYRYYLHK